MDLDLGATLRIQNPFRMRAFLVYAAMIMAFEIPAQVVNGPDAPDLDIGWDGNGFTFTLTNPPGSNNHLEQYIEAIDPPPPGSSDPFWRFQGYMVFQLASADLLDSLAYRLARPAEAKAVVVADLFDSIGSLQYDLDLGGPDSCFQVSWLLTNGGMQASYGSTMDPFTQQSYDPDSTYCFFAVAFASTPLFTDVECGHDRTMLFSTEASNGPLQAICISSATVHVMERTYPGLSVWPVPATDLVHVSGVEGDVVWRVLDPTGRSLLNGSGTASRAGVLMIGLSVLPQGTYLLQVEQGLSRMVERLVVQRN